MSDFFIEKQNKMAELNRMLEKHLKENGIANAVIYAPHCPKEYWLPDNIRIAFCNEEIYSTDGNFEQGINLVTSKMLEDWTDGRSQTIKRLFDINFIIRLALRTGKEISIEEFQSLKKDINKNGKDYYTKYEEMDKSLYFNFRYSIPTDTSAEHKDYIQQCYDKDAFYALHYKAFLEAANPHILIIGSDFATSLFTQIYPELHGKLTYCGEPVNHNGRLIVSMPHPGWRYYSDNDSLTVINKIVRNKGILK